MDESSRGLLRSVVALAPATDHLERTADALPLPSPVDRGFFRPDEEDRLWDWFGQVLTVRDALWQTVRSARESLGLRQLSPRTEAELATFLAGYCAACLLVRVHRLVVETVADHPLVQRKLNEGAGARRIPRKQLTAIFRSLTRLRDAMTLLVAVERQKRLGARLEDLREQLPEAGRVLDQLPEIEREIDTSKRRYLGLWRGYRSHALRRRFASARQKTFLHAVEVSGRMASELRLRGPKQILHRFDEIAPMLRPGDVLLTRHHAAMTNLVLPGQWPHSALYVGTAEQRREFGLHRLPAEPGHATFEALKDGVLFRPLDETLAVDELAVLRPRLSEEEIRRALLRVSEHEGKLYNFDFDFFRSDRLVCTEVIYRAYDGLGGFEFPLRERAGRPTLSADDLATMALDDDATSFEPILVVRGDEPAVGRVAAREALARSLRPPAASG